jgi:hypothetical protein
LARGQFVRADEVGKLFRVDFSYRRIFIVAMCLTGNDLPIAVALKPRVSDVITRFQILPEDRLGLVRVVTEYRCVPNDPALSVLNLNRSGISRRQRCDVSNQLWFVENASFLVGEDAVVGEIFFPRRLIAWHDRIVKLLSASDQFVLRNRNICSADDGCSGQKFNERELFHNKRMK